MKFLDALRSGPQVQRNDMSFQDWINAFQANVLSYPGQWPGYQFTYGKDPAEPIANSFAGYVAGGLQSNGVIFALELKRLQVFSQARFQYQRMRKGRPGDLFGDDSLSILERPWPGGTTGDMLARMILDADFAGNNWQVQLDGEIVRLRPDYVEIVLAPRMMPLGPDGEDVQVGFKQVGILYYESGIYSGVKPAVFAPGEYSHFAPIPDPLAAYRGMSWLTPVIRELQADTSATKHKLKFFENAATPNLAVSLPKEITPEQFEAFVEKMDAKHRGVEQAYKTLYTGGGADVTVIGANMQQLDFKVTQGAGETRLAAAAGIHPVVVALSEGMQGSSLNAGNYTAAKRNTVDTTFRHLWQNAAGSLEPITPPPAGARLWYDARDIPFLHEDQKDVAQIQQAQASAWRQLVDGGMDPDAATAFIQTNDLGALLGQHSGLYSVQLQPPGPNQEPTGETAPKGPAAEAARSRDHVHGSVSSWNAAHPVHPKGSDGKWADTPGVGSAGMPDQLVSVAVKVLGGTVTASAAHDGGGKATLSANGRSVDLDARDLDELRKTIVDAQYGDDRRSGSDGVFRVSRHSLGVDGKVHSEVLVSLRPVEGAYISETGKKASSQEDPSIPDEEIYNAEFDMVVGEGSDGEFDDYPSTRVSLKDLDDDNRKGFFQALERALDARRIDTGNGPTDVFSPRPGAVGLRMKDDDGNAAEVILNARDVRRIDSAMSDVLYGEGEGEDDLSIPRDARMTVDTSGGPVEVRFKGHREDREWRGSLTVVPVGAPWGVAVDGPHIDEFAEAFSLNGASAGILERNAALLRSDVDDDPIGDLDEDTEALIYALDRYAPTGARALTGAAFNAKHKRGPDGRFLTMVDRIINALNAHKKSGGKGDPFKDFDREQLRQAAKARGIPLKRGEDRGSIAAKLLADLNGKPTESAAKPTKPSNWAESQGIKLDPAFEMDPSPLAPEKQLKIGKASPSTKAAVKVSEPHLAPEPVVKHEAPNARKPRTSRPKAEAIITTEPKAKLPSVQLPKAPELVTPSRERSPRIMEAEAHVNELVKTVPPALRQGVSEGLMVQAQIVPSMTQRLKQMGFKDLGSGFAEFVPGGGIKLNEKWKTRRKQLDDLYIREQRDGYLAPSGLKSGLGTAVAHEFGHHVAIKAVYGGNTRMMRRDVHDRVIGALARSLGIDPPKLTPNATAVDNSKTNDWLRRNSIAIRSGISGYAAESIHELLAEAWQEYSTRGKDARPAARMVGEVMRQMAGG